MKMRLKKMQQLKQAIFFYQTSSMLRLAPTVINLYLANYLGNPLLLDLNDYVMGSKLFLLREYQNIHFKINLLKFTAHRKCLLAHFIQNNNSHSIKISFRILLSRKPLRRLKMIIARVNRESKGQVEVIKQSSTEVKNLEMKDFSLYLQDHHLVKLQYC